MKNLKAGLVLVVMLTVGACGGDGAPQGSADVNNSSSASFSTSEEFFTARIVPRMDYCRTCHVSGGVADTSEGDRFLLSSHGDDYALTYEAWQALGGGVESNLLIAKNADSQEPHSGGKNWPVQSDAYNDMVTLLSCWNAPTSCKLNASGSVSDQLPLLGEGHRGGHAWSRFCEAQPDEAILPVDPRSLIRPGINEGKAVYFNAYYKDCHVNAAPEDAEPVTCGQWRSRIEKGSVLMKGNGAQGAAANFVGNFSGSAVIPGFYFTADAYNNMWKTWGGLTERPENYDALVASRWGVVLGQERNPYPLTGEDPNATNGGSGQLPTALTQLREEDGSWSGRLATTCHVCHSGKIGADDEPGLPGAIYGSNSLSDIGVLGRDTLLAGYASGGVLFPALNRVRGTGNITNFQIFNALSLFIDPLNAPNWLVAQTSGSTGSEDPPVWWNFGHRPLKFFDGGMSSDAERIAMSAFTPVGASNPYPLNMSAAFEWIEQHDQDAVAWLLDLKSPKYPVAVDTKLAEQGAILFHSKDLWAEEGNAGRERPKGGNGSCASCHGAYSPRFVNDPNYLVDPSLEGIAGYIVPRDLIGTDPQRLDGNDQEVAKTFERDWFGYPEQRGTENDCGDQNLDRIRGDRENGYLAPPLYGVWATAPYFHNGSVPNVWEVLKSSDRKFFWRRVSEPNDTGLDVVMGFDPSFQRAYDKERLGWRYEELACGNGTGLLPILDCDPTAPEDNPLLDQLLSVVYENVGLAWNVPNLLVTPLTNQQIEDRKIYNTRLYSQDNGGHTFTDVLTDAERLAIIEYLKTL